MKIKCGLLMTASLGLALSAGLTHAQPLPEPTRLSVLEAKLSSLETELNLLEDVQAIKRLQAAYGYYRSKGMGDELANLFADDPTVSIELGGRGVYVGRDSIRAFFNHEANQLEEGEILNHVVGQGVVNVAPDGETARGRWRTLIQAGIYGDDGRWIEGPYENEYVKEDGVWKFQKVHWFITVNGSYDQGWHRKSYPIEGPLEDLPPDRPPSDDFEAYPGVYFKPFHFLHPVTGKPISSSQEDAQ